MQLEQALLSGDSSNIEHACELREALAQGIAVQQAQPRNNPKLGKVSFI